MCYVMSPLPVTVAVGRRELAGKRPGKLDADWSNTCLRCFVLFLPGIAKISAGPLSGVTAHSQTRNRGRMRLEIRGKAAPDPLASGPKAACQVRVSDPLAPARSNLIRLTTTRGAALSSQPPPSPPNLFPKHSPLYASLTALKLNVFPR